MHDVEAGRTETDEGQEETDSGSDGERDRTGDQPGEPLSETKDGEKEEYDSLQEDGSQSFAVTDGSGTLERAIRQMLSAKKQEHMVRSNSRGIRLGSRQRKLHHEVIDIWSV